MENKLYVLTVPTVAKQKKKKIVTKVAPTRAGTGDGIPQPAEDISSSEDELNPDTAPPLSTGPEPEPFTGTNKKAVFAEIMKVVTTFIMNI